MSEFTYFAAAMEFDPRTGIFTWKHRPRSHFNSDQAQLAWNGKHSGHRAGCRTARGYRAIRFAGKLHYEHRLAILFTTGDWPVEQVDHINGVKTDNRLSNLRPATNAENCYNLKLQRRNTSGTKGVSWDESRGKWQAKIGRAHIGRFDSIQEARVAIAVQRERLHGEFANHG